MSQGRSEVESKAQPALASEVASTPVLPRRRSLVRSPAFFCFSCQIRMADLVSSEMSYPHHPRHPRHPHYPQPSETKTEPNTAGSEVIKGGDADSQQYSYMIRSY